MRVLQVGSVVLRVPRAVVLEVVISLSGIGTRPNACRRRTRVLPYS